VSGDAVALAGLLVLLVAGAALELSAWARRRVATAGQAIGAAMRTLPGRALMLLAWVWLGVHFLAR
jgi:hypothetical protein